MWRWWGHLHGPPVLGASHQGSSGTSPSQAASQRRIGLPVLMVWFIVSIKTMTKQPAWRRAPFHCTLRVGLSIVRRKLPVLVQPIVRFDDERSTIIANLRTATGLTLYRYGINTPELYLTRLLLKSGDLFVDGGANIGIFTLVAAAKVGSTGKVLACEPAPQSAAMLRQNVELNDFSWVEVKQAALAERAGHQPFTVFGGDASGFSSFAPESVAGAQVCTVELLTIDDLVAAPERSRLGLVKLDVEGAELRVLQGAKDTLGAVGPDMLVEIEPDHLARQGGSVAELRRLLGGLGYQAYGVRWASDGHGIQGQRCGDWLPAPESPNLFLTRNIERAEGAGITLVH
jgi:FkbM family methyltransferase